MTDTYTTDTSRVVSVWSVCGHHFIGEDGNYEQCLACGAMYELLAYADDPTRGEYVNARGGEPMECTHDTGMVHGYPGEREDGPNHGCDCFLCG